MASIKQTGTRRKKMAERAQEQMELLFPNLAPEWIWHRSKNDGYCTLPRTLPIAMQVIDNQSKGSPAGHTLFCLWARSPDHPLVTIENPATFAAEAGFTGERAVHTWRKKMKKLTELNFILPRKGPSGEYHHVLLINPNMAVEMLWTQGKVQTDLYARFKDRVIEIGAHSDLDNYYALGAKQEAERVAQAAAKAGEVPAPPPPVTNDDQTFEAGNEDAAS